MYVRDAKNREEAWLLDQIEAMGLDDTAFRSRDYVLAYDELSGGKAGFGRIRVHTTENESEDDVCELTSIGVLDTWRGQGVGAHVVERLVEYAGDEGFETVYALTTEGAYLAQFGFSSLTSKELPEVLQGRLEDKRDTIDPDAKPFEIDTEDFEMPAHLREAFKAASERPPEGESGDGAESAEDFGIDTESATYKYDTGR